MMRAVVNDRADFYIPFESLVITVYNERHQEIKKDRKKKHNLVFTNYCDGHSMVQHEHSILQSVSKIATPQTPLGMAPSSRLP
jgi:hypothetical protein